MTRRAKKRFLWTGVVLAALGNFPLAPAHAGLAALDAYHIGRYHLASGERDKALEAFDDAVRMNPQFVQAYIARGKLYAEMGKFESALSDLNFAIRIQPTHPEAFAYRGYALLSLGRPQESIPEFDMALRLDQSYARVYFLRGQALKLLGDSDGASQSVALARRLDPTIETTKVVRAAADGSMKEEIGLVSGAGSFERTPGAGANLNAGSDSNWQSAATMQPGRVIHYQDHPLLGDLRPPRNARPIYGPGLNNPAPLLGQAGLQSNGFPQQFAPSRPLATRAISPAIPDITAAPETPLPAVADSSAPPSDVTATKSVDETATGDPGAAPAEQPADRPSVAAAAANAPAKITLSPKTVVDVPAASAAGELPKIVVIPPPTAIAADGSLPVVVDNPAQGATTTPPSAARQGGVEVPHVVTIPAGDMAPGASGLFKVDPPTAPTKPSPAVVVGDDSAAPSLSAAEILKQASTATATDSTRNGERQLASAVDAARSLLPGDAPSLAHVSDDGSNSPTSLSPAATSQGTDAGAVSAADAAYRQGLKCEESGDTKGALAAFAEASKQNPLNPLPACRRGHLLCELGRTAEALAEFSAAVRAAPGFSSAYFGRAHVLYMTDQLEDAVDDYSIALRLDHRHAEALLERGHCFARMGKAAEAAADRAAAMALDPVLVENGPRYATEVQPRKPLPAGSIIVSDDGPNEASSQTAPESAFQNLFDGARPLGAAAGPAAAATAATSGQSPAAKAAAAQPSGSQPGVIGAVVKSDVVKSDAAVASDEPVATPSGAKTVASIELPADPTLAAQNRSPESSARGVVALDADVADGGNASAGPGSSEKPKSAAEERRRLSKELADRPGDAGLYVARGRACLGMGDAAAALDDASIAIRLAPTDSAALVLRAEALAASDKFPAAHADYMQLVAQDPSDPVLYSGRGFVRLAMGQTNEAIEDFNTALKLDPKKGEVYCQRALAYALAGDRAASLSDFDAAISATPDDAEVFLCRAKALAEFGDKKQALADLNHAIRLDPKKAEAYFERSRLFAERGAYENAQADRRRALELDPSLR